MTRDRTTEHPRRMRPGWRRRSRQREDASPLAVFGANAVLELLRSGEPVTRLYLGRGARARDVDEAAAARGVLVEAVDQATLDRLARSPHHQGIVALAPPFRYRSLEDLLVPGCGSALVLDGVQDPRNLGAILRTARAVGVGGVVLPTDRSAGITSVVASAAAGLLFGLSIARVPNLARAIGALRDAGFWSVALVPSGGENLYGFTAPARPALVVGGEGEGVRSLVRRSCDFAVSIPMAPGVESLNAAVAAAIALYEIIARPVRS